MKLAVITDEVSQDLEVVLALARAFGLAAIELRSLWNKAPHELTADEVRRIKQRCADEGLTVCSIASPVFKCDYGDPRQEQAHMDILRRCVDIAHELGAPLVRIFTFWRKPPYPSWDAIAEKLHAAACVVEGTGLILGVENEPTTMATNARKVVAVLTRLQHPQVKAVWDPGNDVFDPDREVPYPDGYETVKAWIAHIHIKDGKWNAAEERFEPTPIGDGAVDYRNQLRALVQNGYDGYLSLETHWRPVTQLPEDLVQMPKGEQFSYMGDVASRECLTRLKALLREVGAPVAA
ncbi:D-tagatose 3-epimerase [bacterium HR17]|jgi:sugar phosphate isomerase/epimerase|uniref:D-tagatose 3-epimerase n=1 Tax=Candidatus Fervidibacter japonicus TaxID=2035412 RepID=A0A2H5XCN0_9BACT|nr:D-tagatose 3-epimerase [bacterium HR17]